MELTRRELSRDKSPVDGAILATIDIFYHLSLSNLGVLSPIGKAFVRILCTVIAIMGGFCGRSGVFGKTSHIWVAAICHFLSLSVTTWPVTT